MRHINDFKALVVNAEVQGTIQATADSIIAQKADNVVPYIVFGTKFLNDVFDGPSFSDAVDRKFRASDIRVGHVGTIYGMAMWTDAGDWIAPDSVYFVCEVAGKLKAKHFKLV